MSSLNLLTVQDMADRLGSTIHQIYWLIRNRKLPRSYYEGHLIVGEPAFERYLATRHTGAKRGRKKST